MEIPHRHTVLALGVAASVAALAGRAGAEDGPSCDRWREASPRQQLEVSVKTIQRRLGEARSSPLAACMEDQGAVVANRTTELCNASAASFGEAIRQALEAGMGRCLASGSPHAHHEIRLRVARDAVDRITRGQLESAAALVDPPHHLSVDEQRKETEVLARALQIVTRELGYPSKLAPVERFEGGHAEVGSGLIEGWRGFPERLLIFETWYSREGPGFLTCRFVLTDRGWQLGAFIFTLPASRPDSRARMAEISGTLLRELAPDL